jgi:cytochrome P450
VFDRPELFDIGRDDAAYHLTFSVGPQY